MAENRKRGKIVTTVALLGFLAAPAAQAAKIDLMKSVYHPNHPEAMCQYGSGREELTYKVTLTTEDVKGKDGKKYMRNQDILRNLAQVLHDRIFKDICGCSVDEITTQLFEQNPFYDPTRKKYSELREGDRLLYKTSRSVGSGLRCSF